MIASHLLVITVAILIQDYPLPNLNCIVVKSFTHDALNEYNVEISRAWTPTAAACAISFPAASLGMLGIFL